MTNPFNNLHHVYISVPVHNVYRIRIVGDTSYSKGLDLNVTLRSLYDEIGTDHEYHEKIGLIFLCWCE